MKPLFLTQAGIKQKYDGDVSLEIVIKGGDIALFVTRDTPIIITPYEPSGLRRLVGDACYVFTPATQHGLRVVGSVPYITKTISDHLGRTA